MLVHSVLAHLRVVLGQVLGVVFPELHRDHGELCALADDDFQVAVVVGRTGVLHNHDAARVCPRLQHVVRVGAASGARAVDQDPQRLSRLGFRRDDQCRASSVLAEATTAARSAGVSTVPRGAAPCARVPRTYPSGASTVNAAAGSGSTSVAVSESRLASPRTGLKRHSSSRPVGSAKSATSKLVSRSARRGHHGDAVVVAVVNLGGDQALAFLGETCDGGGSDAGLFSSNFGSH